MNRFMTHGPKRDKKPYDRDNLKRAFEATLTGMSVYRASRVYLVPESTLRDRTRHNVEVECKSGPQRIFSLTEESKLVDHIQYMANIGYGYSVMDIKTIAAEFGKSLGKNIKAKGELSSNWFNSFMKRNDVLKTVKPQKLCMQRAKTASKDIIMAYFKELENIMEKNNLTNSPARIWNIDESGFSTEHSPPKIVCGKDVTPQAVTSPRGKNVTMIGAINALGNHVPPFYIFPGKRWNPDYLKNAATGSTGHMSESGWVNRGIFEEYVTTHLAEYAAIQKDGPPSLILYDGHKSHLSLTLTNWAKERNVILFVLPPHSSHITQPLDVGVFGPMKAYYNRECRVYLHQHPGVSITPKEIAQLTATPFTKAFCPENIINAFKKSGIFPLNGNTITDAQTAPATIYPKEDDSVETDQHEQQLTQALSNTESYLDSIKITSVVQRPRKKFQPPIKITGNLSSQNNIDHLQKQHDKRQILEESSNSNIKKKSISSPKPSTINIRH